MSRVNEPLNPTEAHVLQPWVAHYSQSDSVQVVLENGTAIYTHLRNVKLTYEDAK